MTRIRKILLNVNNKLTIEEVIPNNEIKNKMDNKLKCDCTHFDNELLNTVVPIHIDELFELLFTDSNFMKEFRKQRQITDFIQSTWSLDSNIGLKVRHTTSTFPLDYFLGPKSTIISETQVIQPCSKPGYLFSINIEANNQGIPLANSFCIQTHYCLRFLSESRTQLLVYSRVNYFKSLPSFVKVVVEKNYWSGIRGYMRELIEKLQQYSNNYQNDILNEKEEFIPSIPRKTLSRVDLLEEVIDKSNKNRNSFDLFNCFIIVLLLTLLVVVIFLYYKLWSIEDLGTIRSFPDFNVNVDLPETNQEWIQLIKKKDYLHENDLRKIGLVVNEAIDSLHKNL